jgi:hypothetical protein
MSGRRQAGGSINLFAFRLDPTVGALHFSFQVLIFWWIVAVMSTLDPYVSGKDTSANLLL